MASCCKAVLSHLEKSGDSFDCLYSQVLQNHIIISQNGSQTEETERIVIPIDVRHHHSFESLTKMIENASLELKQDLKKVTLGLVGEDNHTVVFYDIYKGMVSPNDSPLSLKRQKNE
ncbi:PREDICTED: uncharacterized protein LOC109581357 [Amphimedon queenslandica]|uniref:tRNA-splicing endonuclease subunit Sen15 domain-containing protein n=1 Tax=Amphimedon queenslandica TaxID=400682 RepID=A0AAN0J2M6_AMPQE|nr:PREDICTED: uncharacterized protein LOC109581357 [Amphimedon queenslandica]|eukprot:XP_019850976.1 PREDICTED: uncharacterized protein LOC109581357 [Amphimedon queenslandica]